MSANFRNPNFLLPNEVNMATNPALSEDRHSLYSMEFDGVNDIITVNTSTGVDFSNPFTISLWAKWTAADIIDNTAGIIQLAKESQSYSFMIGTGVGSSNNTFSVSWNNNNYEFGGSYGDGNWHNIIVTGNGVNWSGVKVYIDGANVTGSASSTSALGVNSTVTYIGQNTYGGNRQFKGLIDEVAIWSSDQSNNVSNIYNGGSPANIMALSNKPTAYYPLGEQARDNTNWQFPNEVLQSQVFDFSGSNQNINLGNDASLYPGTSDMSYSFWFKSDSFSGYKTIFLQGAANLNVLSQVDKAVFITTLGDELRVFVCSNTGGFGNDSNNAFDTSNANFVVNQWYHIVFTLDRDGDAVIYVNGVANVTQAVKSSSSSVDIVDTDNSIIGGVAYDFDGQISNFQIFNTVLSSTNVETLYNNGSPYIGTQPQATNLKAWYKLNATNTYAGLNPNFHNALEFDGSSDYIDCGSDSSLSPSSFTFSVWSKSDLSNGGWVTKYASENYGFGIYSGSIYLNIKTSAGWGGLSVTASSYLTADKWHHIVGTYDETNLKIYVDGNLAGTLSKTGPITYSSRNTRIGNLEGTSALDFNGSLSNVAIWNSELTQDQILTIYNGGVPNNISSLSPVSWWSLAGDSYYNGSDWICPDLGSGGNNGTSDGMGGTELVGNGPGSTANGTATGMNIPANLQGNAPNSTKNAFSINMAADDKTSSVPDISS